MNARQCPSFLPILALALAFPLILAFSPGDPEETRLTVPANVAWTDTNLNVVEGEEILFAASGKISLQKENPEAECGPAGIDLMTVQQPFLSKNLGALIGRVTQLISVEVDKETGEQVRNERIELFFVGAENKIKVPLSGKLFLGINENVVADNSGEFAVVITRSGDK